MSLFVPPHLETPRLLLTWPTEEQVQGFYDAIVGTDMFDTILWDGPERVSELLEWWEQNRQRDPEDSTLLLSLAIIERATGLCVGSAALRPRAAEPTTVIISYTMAPMAQGKGYATEAVKRLVDQAFWHRGVQHILGPVFVGNVASRRVLEKAEFQLDGTTPGALMKRGVSIDLWNLSLSRSRWELRGRHP